jgi:peptide/nickel transport system permease protein
LKHWWTQPLTRVLVALALPFLVPALITLLVWALPGDPASIICPPEICGGTSTLAARWNLDQGAVHFFVSWVGNALHGDLGNSWRVQQGVPVRELVDVAVPNTLLLIGLAFGFLLLASVAAAARAVPRMLDPFLQVTALVPAVVLALVGTAIVQLRFGADAYGVEASWIRLVAGAAVLGVADGALSGAILGTRGVFDAERSQRYIQVALLRGENELSNTLPNVAPALVGQFRSRVLHLLSGAVIVEAVLRIDGLGDLLWRATLLQDFGVVLATATGFALLSALLLLVQAMVEVTVAWHVRRAPPLSALKRCTP